MRVLFYLLAISVFLNSCKFSNSSIERFSNEGVVVVSNGRGNPDSLRYSCDKCFEILQEKKVLDTIISIATEEAKSKLRNKLSFIPQSVKLTVFNRDSTYFTNGELIDSLTVVIADYTCIGKNGYGVEGDVESSSIIYLVNNRVMDIKDRIKKDSLNLSSGAVSRTLFVIDDDGSIEIQPTLLHREMHLIVTSDNSCVEDASLKILFDDGESINLESWNDFNCKGLNYFKLSKSQMGKLKDKKVSFVLYSEDEIVSGFLPENERDYFMQYARLISR